MNDNLFQWPKMTISKFWWSIKINQQRETFLFLRHCCLCGEDRCPLLGQCCSVTCIPLHIIVVYTGWDTTLSVYIHWWTWQNMWKWFCHYIWLFIGQWEQSTLVLCLTLKFKKNMIFCMISISTNEVEWLTYDQLISGDTSANMNVIRDLSLAGLMRPECSTANTLDIRFIVC